MAFPINANKFIGTRANSMMKKGIDAFSVTAVRYSALAMDRSFRISDIVMPSRSCPFERQLTVVALRFSFALLVCPFVLLFL